MAQGEQRLLSYFNIGRDIPPLGKTLGNVMSELRSWLDTNKIIPSGFSYETARSGAIAFNLTFGSRHHAELFEQAFCNSPDLPVEQSQKADLIHHRARQLG